MFFNGFDDDNWTKNNISKVLLVKKKARDKLSQVPVESARFFFKWSARQILINKKKELEVVKMWTWSCESLIMLSF